MEPQIVAVSQENVGALVEYSAAFGPEHDESYLPTGQIDLDEQPSYLLKQDGAVVGAVSLLRAQRYLAVRKARFAIMHSRLGTEDAYRRMLDAIAGHYQGIDSVYAFIPAQCSETARILESLDFVVERYSFVLVNKHPRGAEPTWPSGYAIRPLSRDEAGFLEVFADLINRNFQPLAGHTDISADTIRSWFDEEIHLPGGLCLLMHGPEAVGTAYVTRDVGDPRMAELSALSVEKNERGQGLGRGLLRWFGVFARERGFDELVLSVNAENETAVELYRSEGFEQVEKVVCFTLDTSPRATPGAQN